MNRLEELMKELDAALRAKGLRNDVQAGIDDRGLVLSLVSKHVVFEPDLAELSARGIDVIDTITPVLLQGRRPAADRRAHQPGAGEAEVLPDRLGALRCPGDHRPAPLQRGGRDPERAG